MKTLAMATTLAFLAPVVMAIAQAAPAANMDAETPQQVTLWPDARAPINENGTETENAEVSLFVYQPANPNGTAMVVCAGGGYGMNLWKGAEGVRTAKWLNQHGIIAAVLQYRLPGGEPYRTLSDVRRAIRVVRSKAPEWGVDPRRIGIIGYSAGGHLASMAATRFDGGDADSVDPVEKLSCRPDFAVLVYPVITMGADTHAGSRKNLLGKDPSEEMIKLFSSELQVTGTTPPTFLAHAIDDEPVPPGNSRMFHEALLAHKVRTRYLELPNGGHGLNGYKGPSWEAWKSQSMEWMREIKVLPVNADDHAATAKTVPQLQADFRKLEFGMFLHYNMATYKNTQWVAGYHSPADFDPGGKVDTDAWADAAKSAGMTYGVLTAKHVAGFCLWDSKHTTYDVMHPDCPYQQDLVAQFIKSFKSRGLKAGLYYCWRHPGFDAGRNKGKYKVLPPECDPAKHNLAEQVDFQKKQIAELVEKYPDVFYIWNDALDDRIMTQEEANAFVRSLGPGIIASSNWWDWGRKGTPFVDIAVKEMRHFPETNTAPGETCWKLEQGWFWNEGARSGTAKGALGNMAKAHARNSNFLLNVGPDKNGRIIESSVKTLAEIGKWIEK